MDNQYFTVEEAAEYLGFHKMTVYRLIKTKKIPASKPFKEWRIPIKELEQLMEPDYANWK